jgi:hypothetical protein
MYSVAAMGAAELRRAPVKRAWFLAAMMSGMLAATPLLAAAAPPESPPIPRRAPERPPSRILPYLGTPSTVPLAPRVVQTCPQIPGGVAVALGQPSGAVYGSAFGENLGGGPGSTIAQSSAVLGTPCPPALIGGELPPPTLDVSGNPHTATPYRVP